MRGIVAGGAFVAWGTMTRLRKISALAFAIPSYLLILFGCGNLFVVLEEPIGTVLSCVVVGLAAIIGIATVTLGHKYIREQGLAL